MQPKHLILALALSLATGLTAAPFEGIATYKPLGKDAKEAREMEFMIKGDKFRVDMNSSGHQGSMIMDNKTKQAITLMPDRKAYLVMKMDMQPKRKKSAGKLVKTGKTETIAGYKAEEWAFEGDGQKTSFWGTKELGSWTFSSGRGQGPEMEIPKAFKDGGYFPLRMVGEKGGMEAIKVEKKSLDASLFEIPAGYKKMEMGAAMGGASPEQSKAMAEQMKNMTPEQRAMMEKMLKGK
jgi:hypothetical protein